VTGSNELSTTVAATSWLPGRPFWRSPRM